MDKTARLASNIIDSVAKAVANWTVDEHNVINPNLPARYGTRWREDWTGHTLGVLHMLAQSVAVRSAELFSHSMRWTHESFKARGVDEIDLLQNAETMREVLSKELPPPVDQTTLPIVDAALDDIRAKRSGELAAEEGETNEKEAILTYLTAILESDGAAAEATIMSALDRDVSVPEIYESILAPAQTRLGQMWHRGEINVADEHFGSATTQAVMSRLRPHFKPAPAKNRLMVGTSTPGDLHEIGLRMVVDLFELDGWNVVYLGANTPVADLIEFLERRRPDLLALSVSTALMLRDAGELIECIRENAQISTTKVLIGGPPFRCVDGLWREIGADGCALSATQAIALGNQLVNP